MRSGILNGQTGKVGERDGVSVGGDGDGKGRCGRQRRVNNVGSVRNTAPFAWPVRGFHKRNVESLFWFGLVIIDGAQSQACSDVRRSADVPVAQEEKIVVCRIPFGSFRVEEFEIDIADMFIRHRDEER